MATRRSSRKSQSGGKRKTRKLNKKASQWTTFVKKIYMEMKKKNPSVKLGAAMKEASRRKSEM
jgi:hypothetical protein